MTTSQRDILIVLAIVDLLFVCCLVPVLIVTQLGPDSPVNLSNLPKTFAGLVATPKPTSTRGPTATPTKALPTPTLEAGWKLYPASKDGFAIAYPASWTFQNMEPATLQANIQELKKTNPDWAKVLEGQAGQAATNGVRYFAMDFASNSTSGGLTTNSNIIHTVETQAYTIDYYVGVNVKQLESSTLASKPINHRRLNVMAGDIEEVRYTVTMNDANNKPFKIATTQYLFLHGRDSYILTFSVAPAIEARYLPTFEKVARTWRWAGQ